MKFVVCFALSLISAHCCAQFRPATAAPTTLAWSKSYDLGNAKDEGVPAIFLDSHGNQFVLSNCTKDLARVDIRKYNAAGALQWDYNFASPSILLSRLVFAPNGDIYALGSLQENISATLDSLVIRLSQDGVFLGAWNYPGPNGDTMYALAGGFDPSGNLIFASRHNATSYGPDVILTKIDGQGKVLKQVELTQVQANGIDFQPNTGYCVVYGRARLFSGSIWFVYTDALSYKGGGHSVNSGSGVTGVSYDCHATFDPLGNLFVATDKLYDFSTESPNKAVKIAAYNPAVVLQWTSSYLVGNIYINQLFANDLDHVGLLVDNSTVDANFYKVHYVGAGGVLQWTKNVVDPARMGLNGSIGAFVVRNTGTSPNHGFAVEDYTVPGDLAWSIDVPAVIGFPTLIYSAKMFQNTLRLGGLKKTVAAGYDVYLPTYAVGTVLDSVSLTSATNVGGGPINGSGILNQAAGGSGVNVSLSSSNTALLWAPDNFPVAAGATTGAFTLYAAPVDVSTVVTLNAAYHGVLRSTTVTLNRAALSTVVPAKASTKGGTIVACTVNLNGNCAVSGRTLTLTSSNTTAATVPASVFIPPYAKTATFNITTKVVGANAAVTISAKDGAVTKTGALTVTP